MLDASSPSREIVPADRLTPRQQIDSIQLLSLVRRLAQNGAAPRPGLLRRVASRLDEDFFGQPLGRKIKFVGYAAAWVLRRWTVRRATASLPPTTSKPDLGRPLRVAVHGTGSLGDFLTHMAFMQEFYRRFGPIGLDFYAHPKKVGEAQSVFERASFVKDVRNVEYLPALKSNYDLIVYLRYVVRYEIINRERLLQRDPDLISAIDTSQLRMQPYEFVFDNHPFFDGFFGRMMASETTNLLDATGYLAAVDVSRKTIPFFCADIRQFDIVRRHGLDKQRYITVHDGFDTSHDFTGTSATKCWPLGHWCRFVASIKERRPDLKVVQLGSSNSRQIAGVDLDLRNRTTLDEAAWILKGSRLHIDGESGLVRLAHAHHTRSVVLFGPTSSPFFTLEGNIDLVSDVCNDCWWSTQDWVKACPRGLATPVCMEAILPETVVGWTERALESAPSVAYRVQSISLRCAEDTDRVAETLAEISRTLESGESPGSANHHGIALDRSRGWEHLGALGAVDAMTRERGRFLDVATIGGGRSALAPYLAAIGHHVDVFDMDYARDAQRPDDEDKFRRWSAKNGLQLAFGSPFNVPARGGRYDMVVALHLEGTPHTTLALREALRLLKPGGRLFASFKLSHSAAPAGDRDSAIVTMQDLTEILAELDIPDAMPLMQNVQPGGARVPTGIADAAGPKSAAMLIARTS